MDVEEEEEEEEEGEQEEEDEEGKKGFPRWSWLNCKCNAVTVCCSVL